MQHPNNSHSYMAFLAIWTLLKKRCILTTHNSTVYIKKSLNARIWSTWTPPTKIYKKFSIVAKSSVKFLELDYVIFQLNEELEEVNVEMIIQTLSAVECLLIKCRSDPNFMSPTFLKPNFGATLVVKEILESEILICDFGFNDMSLCS